MRILDLSVYEVHLDNIETGAKTIEFREMTDYWIERLVDMAKLPGKTPSEVRLMLLRGEEVPFVQYDEVVFHSGERSVTTEYVGISTYKNHRLFAIRIRMK